MQRNIYNKTKTKQKKTKKKKKERKSRVWRNEHRPKAINYRHDDNRDNKYEFIYSHNGACEGSRLISRVTNYSLILARNFIVNL